MTAALTLAVSAGALAAFNPCGFALLPAYLTLFLGENRARGTATARALAVGLAVTTGFVLVFGTVGLAVTALSVRLGDWLSFVTMGSGALLVVTGVYLLTGRDASLRIPAARLRIDGSARGMVAYGVVYATVSLSCTLPIFLAAVVSSFTLADGGGSFATGVVALLGYALGMGAVLFALALLTALFGDSVTKRARSFTPHMKRVSAVFLLVAGGYVVWYGWVEYQAFQGRLIADGPVSWVGDASARVSAALTSIPSGLLVAAALGALLTAGAVVTIRKRRGRPAGVRR